MCHRRRAVALRAGGSSSRRARRRGRCSDLLTHNVALPAAIGAGDLPGDDLQAWLDGLVARRRTEPLEELAGRMGHARRRRRRRAVGDARAARRPRHPRARPARRGGPPRSPRPRRRSRGARRAARAGGAARPSAASAPWWSRPPTAPGGVTTPSRGGFSAPRRGRASDRSAAGAPPTSCGPCPVRATSSRTSRSSTAILPRYRGRPREAHRRLAPPERSVPLHPKASMPASRCRSARRSG